MMPRRYNELEHLILSIYLNQDRSKRPMAIFTAYFDESGSPDEGKALVVAGYVASAEQWLLFDKEWTELLDAEGVRLFHMRDFAHSRREFTNWKGDEKRRDAFMKRLVGIIRRRLRFSIAAAAILEDFRKINQRYMFEEWLGPPYALCALVCMKNAAEWANERGYVEPVNCVFEDGAKHKKEFKRLVERFPLRDPIFGTKDGYVAFQAADLVAWESLKNYTNIESGIFNHFRDSFEALYNMPKNWVVFNEGALEETRRNIGIPLRKEPTQ